MQHILHNSSIKTIRPFDSKTFRLISDGLLIKTRTFLIRKKKIINCISTLPHKLASVSASDATKHHASNNRPTPSRETESELWINLQGCFQQPGGQEGRSECCLLHRHDGLVQRDQGIHRSCFRLIYRRTISMIIIRWRAGKAEYRTLNPQLPQQTRRQQERTHPQFRSNPLPNPTR